MEDKNFYLLPVRCKNCRHEYEATIPKGMKYEDIECINCGLKELDEQKPKQFGISPESCV